MRTKPKKEKKKSGEKTQERKVLASMTEKYESLLFPRECGLYIEKSFFFSLVLNVEVYSVNCDIKKMKIKTTTTYY